MLMTLERINTKGSVEKRARVKNCGPDLQRMECSGKLKHFSTQTQFIKNATH